MHALHKRNSIFAGMLMFTEHEVLQLRTLSNVSGPFLVDMSIYNNLKSELALEDLKAHYSSYLAAGSIGVYNPVSIMSAFQNKSIGNFWVATGLLVPIVFVLQPTEKCSRRIPSVKKKISRGQLCPR